MTISLEERRHGHRATYIAGCRCRPCKDACARYERGRQWDLMQGRDRTLPLLGARRRINALQAIGWSAEYLSVRMGYSRAWLNMTVNHNGTGRIYRRNFEQIAALYDELHMTPGPSQRTRRRAQSKGWPPPLAWDDIDRDPEPPAALYDEPGVDPVVVMRLLEGVRVKANKAEKDAAMRQWRADGNPEAELCRIHSWKTGRYGREPVLTLVEDVAS